MTTKYTGIDYSAGQPVNRNTETGIRYGIIPQNRVMPEAIDDIFQNGTDLDFADYQDEIKKQIRNAIADFVLSSRLDGAVESAFDAIADETGDNYQGSGDCTRMEYKKDGLSLLCDSSGDLWVLESPYFTFAQFCSPCAPGACYLTSPLETPNEANKCYCLPADWFSEDEKCPYPIYDVKTGELQI